jgi:lysophospholipase L1-like esterase
MPTRNYSRLPFRSAKMPRRARLIGDSMTGRGNYVTTISAAQAVAGTMTFTSSAHAQYTGADAYVFGFADEEYNGYFESVTRVDASNFSVPCDLNVANNPTLLSNCVHVNQCRVSDRNWFAMANYANGAPISDILNFGVSGDKTNNIRDRFYKHLLPQCNDGDIVQLQGGINDLQNQAAADVPEIITRIVNNYTAMTEECLNRNLIPIYVNITPYDSALGGSWNATSAMAVMNINHIMQDYYETIYQDGIYLDMHRCVVDFASANGNFLASMKWSDNIHITPLAAQRAASLLASQLAQFRYVRKSRSRTIGQVPATDPSCKQIWLNPVNNGVTGTRPTAGAGSGTNTGDFVSDNVTCTLTRSTTGTNVNSRSARADGMGYDSICTFNPAAANDQLDIVGANFVAGAVAGKKYHAEITISLTGVGALVSKLEFGWENSDGTNYTSPQCIHSANQGQIGDDVTNWTLRTARPFKMSSAFTSLKWRLRVTAAGAGGPIVLTYSQPSFYEVVD